jgi:plasmid stabilization system protein ParE
MNQTLIIHPGVQADVNEAMAYYEGQSVHAASAFLDAFRSALARIAENPFQYQVIDDPIRRAPMGRSPYGLLYAVSHHDIMILSCFHGRRDPGRWRDRLLHHDP